MSYNNWTYTANSWEHNGNIDDNGQPTYADDADWVPVVVGWPCGLQSATGGETLRGLQVTAETSHVATGEYYGGNQIGPQQRLVIAGTTFEVIAAMDPDGLHRTTRVLLKRQV